MPGRTFMGQQYGKAGLVASHGGGVLAACTATAITIMMTTVKSTPRTTAATASPEALRPSRCAALMLTHPRMKPIGDANQIKMNAAIASPSWTDGERMLGGVLCGSSGGGVIMTFHFFHLAIPIQCALGLGTYTGT